MSEAPHQVKTRAEVLRACVRGADYRQVKLSVARSVGNPLTWGTICGIMLQKASATRRSSVPPTTSDIPAAVSGFIRRVNCAIAPNSGIINFRFSLHLTGGRAVQSQVALQCFHSESHSILVEVHI